MTQVSPDTAALIEAALGYAARGWPVFPCSPKDKTPLLPKDKDGEGKPIPKSGGVNKATTDADQIRAWWKRWPKAPIGVATGHERMFVLDFDPRVDDATGEVWTLERLKSDLEAQMGCEVPASLTGLTQSGGVHVWLSWPDDGGDEIRNRGNLPAHVDVRGKGGYVIAPPSVMANGNAYRWLREREICEAPAALVEILRSRDKAAAPPSSAERPAQPPRPRSHGDDPVEAARRKWAIAALDNAVGEAEQLPDGGRNNGVNAIAYSLGRIVGAGYLSETTVRAELERVARLWPNVDKTVSTIERGLADGKAAPRDMSDIGQGAAQADRWKDYDRRGGEVRGSSAAPAAARPSAAAKAGPSTTVPGGRVAIDSLTAVEAARARAIGRHWLRGQLRSVKHDIGSDALQKLAYRLGTRIAAGLLVDLIEGDTRSKLHALAILIALNPDAAKSYERGLGRPLDLGPIRLTLECAQFPLTDFGLAERFNARFGQDFRFTTAKGWLGWDGMRWAVLDQDEKSPPARVIAAAWDTVRALQDEARAIEGTGNKHDGGLDWGYWKSKHHYRYFHEDVAAFGRLSETSGKPEGIQKLVRKWLTVPIEQFDCDPLAVNVLNGTLRFRREMQGDRRVAAVSLEAHRREDYNTKLCPVDYDETAECPLYDGFIEWAQPDANVRRYLRQVVGYAITGHTGEQKLWFHYGRGANGKSTAFDIWAWCAGDYAGTIGIETFLDQGIKKRGEQASPDLARLGGVRFLRSSEPERGAKLNEALIKAATGEEPMAVRALHRGFFDLRPLFKLHIAGNYKPEIPGTDEGIWRRMKLVPWDQHRAQADRDELLGQKLRAEASGVLRWMIAGVLDWLEYGLVEPEAVTSATAQYREDSDPLARFLKMCVVEDPDGREQASELHQVFCAWAKAAGEVEWKITGFGKAMRDKGIGKKRSDGIHWLGIKLVKSVHDFVDADGRVKHLGGTGEGEDDAATARPFAPPAHDPWRPGQFDDDFEPPDF